MWNLLNSRPRNSSTLLCFLATVFLSVVPLAKAQESATGPDLGIPSQVIPSGQYVTLKPKTTAKAITYIGMSGVDPVPSDFLSDPRWFLLDTRGLATGRYLFSAVGSLDDVHTRASFVVVIGDAPPDPVPPGPGPVPPGPVDPNDRKPIADGFRVMMVWEDEDRGLLPREQLLAITGGVVTSYLNTKCEKDERGRPDWHLYDDDFTEEQIAYLPERWQRPYKDCVTRFRKENVPVIVLSNTRKPTKEKGILTVLPKTAATIMPLLQKYGDN